MPLRLGAAHAETQAQLQPRGAAATFKRQHNAAPNAAQPSIRLPLPPEAKLLCRMLLLLHKAHFLHVKLALNDQCTFRTQL